MDMRIPPLKLKILPESNPLKSRILVRRLAVAVNYRAAHWHCFAQPLIKILYQGGELPENEGKPPKKPLEVLSKKSIGRELGRVLLIMHSWRRTHRAMSHPSIFIRPIFKLRISKFGV